MFTVPAGPQLDNGAIGFVSVVSKVKILFSVRNTDPVGAAIFFVRPDVPNVGFRSAYDPLPIAGIALKAQVGALLGVPDVPPVLHAGEVPLLISPSMASPTMDGPVVADVEIDDGSRLLVGEDVAISRFNGHDGAREGSIHRF